MALLNSFIFDASKGQTPEQLARQRALAAQLAAQIGGNRQARNVGEGLGNAFASIGQGIATNVLNRRADAGEQVGMSGANDLRSQFMAAIGGSGAFPAAPAPAMGGGAATGDPMSAYQNAIASIESAGSGDYSAVGPTHEKLGRALGRYQVMEANIGPWSEKHLGRRVTPEEFMANPQIQDAIFNGEFGSYVNKYGPEGAAQAWFGGEGGVGKLNRRDSLGTSIGGYTEKFNRALGGTPAMAANEAMAAGQPIGVAETEADILAQERAMAAQDPMSFAAHAPQQTAPMSPAPPPTQVAQASGGLPEMAGNAPMQQPSGPSTQQLLQVLQNPFMDEGTKSYAQALLQQQMQQNDPYRQAQIAQMQAQTQKYQRDAERGSTTYGLNPIYGQDAQGNTVLGVLGNDGSFKPVNTGDVNISTGVDRVDLGTQWGLLDKRTGQMVGSLPKENYQEAFDTQAGSQDAKSAAEARSNLPKVEDNATAILGMIESLSTDPYLDSMVGPISGRLPNVSADAARVQSKMDQIGGQAFLQAFETLRGGGQISNVEGERATAALARLNTAQSPQDYRQALEELSAIVRTSLSRAQRSAGAGTSSNPPPGASGDGWQDIGGVRIRRKQ